MFLQHTMLSYFHQVIDFKLSFFWKWDPISQIWIRKRLSVTTTNTGLVQHKRYNKAIWKLESDDGVSFSNNMTSLKGIREIAISKRAHGSMGNSKDCMSSCLFTSSRRDEMWRTRDFEFVNCIINRALHQIQHKMA